MNVGIGTEAVQLLFCKYINSIFGTVHGKHTFYNFSSKDDNKDQHNYDYEQRRSCDHPHPAGTAQLFHLRGRRGPIRTT
jgi:hypothetical protein